MPPFKETPATVSTAETPVTRVTRADGDYWDEKNIAARESRKRQQEEEIDQQIQDLRFPTLTSAIVYGNEKMDRPKLVSNFIKWSQSQEFSRERDFIHHSMQGASWEEDYEALSAEEKEYLAFYQFMSKDLKDLSSTERVSLLRETFHLLVENEDLQKNLQDGFFELVGFFPENEVPYVIKEMLSADKSKQEKTLLFLEAVSKMPVRGEEYLADAKSSVIGIVYDRDYVYSKKEGQHVDSVLARTMSSENVGRYGRKPDSLSPVSRVRRPL